MHLTLYSNAYIIGYILIAIPIIGILGMIALPIGICRIAKRVNNLRNNAGNNWQPPYDQQYQPPYDQSYQPPILNEQNAVRCPHCLELTPNSSQFCIKCGCKLN